MTNFTLPRVSRRAFMQCGSLVLAGGSSLASSMAAVAEGAPEAPKRLLRIGLVTDIHYADKQAAGDRYYRESLGKLEKCIAHFNENDTDFAVELGDLIDLAGTVKDEIHHLKTIDEKFAAFPGERHYVLGNHCVDGLNKKEFFANCGAREPFYSFDHGPFHFIILDSSSSSFLWPIRLAALETESIMRFEVYRSGEPWCFLGCLCSQSLDDALGVPSGSRADHG